MTIIGPVAVRIGDGTIDRHVTAVTSGLTFRKEAPGGHLSASFEIDLSLDDFPTLGQNDRVTIYSTITGKVLWDGDSGVITKVQGNQGEHYEIVATGGSGRLTDQTLKLIYLDRTADHWQVDPLMVQVAGGEVSLGDVYPSGLRAAGGTEANPDGSGRTCCRVQIPSGTPVVANSQVSARYMGFIDSIMYPGGFAGYTPDVPVGTRKLYGDKTGGTGGAVYDATQISALAGSDGFAITAAIVGGPPGAGKWPILTDSVAFGILWNGGATTIAVDTLWMGVDPPVIMGQLVTKAGALVNMATYAGFTLPTPYILPHNMIADIVGRLNYLNGAAATIATTTYQIQQAVFADGITPADLLNWLTLYEPDRFHEILERDDTTGLFTFVYRTWDDVNPRYVIYRDDDYDAPGGESPLCNELHVFWTDPGGVARETVVTVAVPDLDTPAFGPARKRQAEPVTLPDGVANAADATRIGTSLLTQANRGTGAGSVVVRRWVWDLFTQTYVHHSELLPGYGYQLAETGEIFRGTAIEYNDREGATTVTLGYPVRTPEELVADLFRRGRTSDRQTR